MKRESLKGLRPVEFLNIEIPQTGKFCGHFMLMKKNGGTETWKHQLKTRILTTSFLEILVDAILLKFIWEILSSIYLTLYMLDYKQNNQFIFYFSTNTFYF